MTDESKPLSREERRRERKRLENRNRERRRLRLEGQRMAAQPEVEWPDNDGEFLPREVPQNREHGVEWHRGGLCVACGRPKENPTPYHCDACYSDIHASIADFDDD